MKPPQTCDLTLAGIDGICHRVDAAAAAHLKGGGRKALQESEACKPQLKERKRLLKQGRRKGSNRKCHCRGLNVCVPPPPAPEFVC